MVKAKFVILYFVTSFPEVEVRRLLKTYVVLLHPDVDTLTDALLQASFQDRRITVIRTSEGIIYVAPGEYRIENEEKSYEFIVGKEEGLRKVAEEILGVKSKWGLNTIVNVIQGILWGMAVLLGYLGYKNDAFKDVSSYMMIILVASWLLENFRRGYKKRERVRASAPRHGSE
ncbi:hypothetical protein [Thermococcus sp.]